jgi:hypothetical protein
MEKIDYTHSQKFVNDLSDFLSQQISENGKYRTEIEISDYETFYTIKGHTQNAKIYNINNSITEFINSQKYYYNELNSINTIDLITYEFEFPDVDEDLNIYFDVIDTKPKKTTKSEFPNGYVNHPHSSFYNLLKITHDKSKYYFKNNWSKFNVTIKNDNITINEYDSDSYYSNTKLLSILKDNLDGSLNNENNLDLIIL